MSKKTKETVTNEQAGVRNLRTAVYTHIGDAISDVIKQELTVPQPPTRISDIKLTGLKTALGNVNVVRANIDTKPIIKTLKANADEIKTFIKSHSNLFLSSTMTYQLPRFEVVKEKLEWVNKNDYKELTPCFKKDSCTINSPDGKGKCTINGFKITDYERLIEAIKNTVPQTNSHNICDINQNSNQDFEQPEFWQPNPVLLEFSKLARHIGVEPSGDLVFREIKNIKDKTRQIYAGKYTEPSNDPNIITTDVRESDHLVYIYILYALVGIKDKADKALKNKRTVVNIKNAEKHDIMMQPHVMGLTDMIDGAFDDRDLKNLYENYRKEGYGSNEQIKKDGGWLVHLDGQQGELPFDLGETDKKALIKFMTNIKALVIDVTTALYSFLRDNPDHDPNDYISLTSLAKYIKRFNNNKLKRGELKPQHRAQMLNGLNFTQLISADYVVGKDKKGNKKWCKVYLINRITEYKTYGNTGIVTGVKVDFTKEYKESMGLNLGVILDGVLSLNTAEHKALGAYILERFAQYQEATTRGEPQKFTADTLIKKAGITDDNETNRLATLQKALDTFVKNGLIEKWVCKNGAKAIRGCDKDSKTILIYPTKNLIESYATKGQTQAERKALKLVQKNRLTALKKWFDGYTKLEPASQVLGVSVAELNELLAGSKAIDDDIIDKINEEL